MRLRKKDGSKWSHARVMIAVLSSLIVCALLFISCSSTGACVGTGGIVDECKEDWDKDECQEWDDLEVNDANWSWHRGDSCDDRGYSVKCPDGSFVKSASDC